MYGYYMWLCSTACNGILWWWCDDDDDDDDDVGDDDDDVAAVANDESGMIPEGGTNAPTALYH